MAEPQALSRDLDRLDAQLDSLEDAMAPLLTGLAARAAQLPLLDRAKLFSLTAYSIESLLFSALKLQGVDAQSHPVFNELKRVQQYFAKIKAAEEPEQMGQPSTTLNQEAAARMLKADLADDTALSSKLAEKIAEERARALLKSVDDAGGAPRAKKRPAEDGGEGDEQGSDGGERKTTMKKKKKKKKTAQDEGSDEGGRDRERDKEKKKKKKKKGER